MLMFSGEHVIVYFHSYLDTAIQLSAHADVTSPSQGMNTHKTSIEWREDVMNNNWIPIKVAPENLMKSQISR